MMHTRAWFPKKLLFSPDTDVYHIVALFDDIEIGPLASQVKRLLHNLLCQS